MVICGPCTRLGRVGATLFPRISKNCPRPLEKLEAGTTVDSIKNAITDPTGIVSPATIGDAHRKSVSSELQEHTTQTSRHLLPTFSPSMKPTQALGVLKYRHMRLTTKDVNKGFYKGNRVGSMGSHTKWGGYMIDWNKVRTYVVPEKLQDPAFKVG